MSDLFQNMSDIFFGPSNRCAARVLRMSLFRWIVIRKIRIFIRLWIPGFCFGSIVQANLYVALPLYTFCIIEIVCVTPFWVVIVMVPVRSAPVWFSSSVNSILNCWLKEPCVCSAEVCASVIQLSPVEMVAFLSYRLKMISPRRELLPFHTLLLRL